MTRKRLSTPEQIHLGKKPKQKEPSGRNPRYTLTDEEDEELSKFRNTSENLGKEGNVNKKVKVASAWDGNGGIMNIDEYCKHYGLPRKDIHSYKLVTNTGTPYYNPLFKDDVIESVLDFDIEAIVKKHIKPIALKIKKQETKTFDRLVYSDTHIGMTPNENGYSLYGGKWDEIELNKNLDKIIEEVFLSQSSDTLMIDDLGDLMDGWNGETVRKGHHLPQNMDNEQAFDIAIKFKVNMVDKLINLYDYIVLNNICNDNHSGSFGYVVNSAVKTILEQKYKNVKVQNHRKFISHYTVGKHAFVLSHGKDAHALKFGFKPHLDTKQIEKIDQYLKVNNLYKIAEFIEFSKGDSHQLLFDMCGSDDFDYYNYGAMSPSSEWVQTNFKKGRSSAVFFNIDYNKNRKIPHIIYF